MKILKLKSHWSLYHLVVGGLLISLIIAVSLRLVWAYMGNGYVVSASGVVPYAKQQVWHWSTDNVLRPLWQVGTYDMARLYGKVDVADSTRRLFMIKQGERWLVLETTMEADPGRYLRVMQEAPTENRYYEVTLATLTNCQTTVTLREVGVLHDFWPRYFLFWTKAAREGRLADSLGEMEKWMKKRGETCEK